MIIVLFIQTLLFALSIFGKNTIDAVTSEYLQALDNRVLVRKNDLQEEMINRWSNITDFHAYIQKEYKDSGSAEDNSLLPELLEDLAEETVFYLRQTGATEIFVILEGEEQPEGMHLRDLDPSFNSNDHSDILMERGSMTIAKKLGVSLDSKWSSTFDLSLEDEASNFYYKPYLAAHTHQYTEIQDLGYWSKPFKLSPDDIEIVTYSLPLVDEEGEVYGVMGIGLTVDYLSKKLKYDELAEKKRGFYILSSQNQETNTNELVVRSGPMSKIFQESESISYHKVENEHMYKISGHDKIDEDMYASRHELILYNENTPFKQESWNLTGFVERKYLFSPIRDIFVSLIGSLLLSMIFGILAVYIIGNLFMKPINKLMNSVKDSSLSNPFKLKKTKIPEIDELGLAIEHLNREVLDSASKLSQILSMVNIPIGAFEYTRADDQAFCTDTFYKILDIPKNQHKNYVDRVDLVNMLAEIRENPLEDIEDVYYYQKANGADSWIELTIDKQADKVLGIIEDVTDEIIYKRKLEYERDHDVLTYLLNRRAFATRVQKKMAAGIPGHSAFIMWDLDNLKYVNDTYGHEYGDRYIRKTAEVLKLFSVYQTVIARMSGDEFYIFIYGYEEKEKIRQIIQEIKKSLYNAFLDLPDGEKIRIRASGGVSWYPDDSSDYNELITYSDFAMYEIKNMKKGEVGEFDKETYKKDSILLDGKEELNFFIDHAMVKYAFQPIISAKTGEVFAYEALMRPQTKKMQSPYDVIRLAQSQSKLYEIEKLTFFEAMKTYERLIEQFKGAKIFINSLANTRLSEEDLAQFEQQFAGHLDQLVIEITENEQANEKCTKLKQYKVNEWGTHLALDDFGSGYNSELSLLVLSPKYVKVDMNIVRDIDKDSNRQKLLENILSYCKNRGIKIIAEGVETKEEMISLIEFGIDYMQGYYLGKPNLDPQATNKKAKEEIQSFHQKS